MGSIFPSNAIAQNPEWLNYSDWNWVEDIAEEGDYLWIATGVGLYKLHKPIGEKELINSATGLPGNSPRAIAIDKSGNKWIGTQQSGLAKFDGTSWSYYHSGNSPLPENSGIPGSVLISALLVDSHDVLWVGTFNGLAIFDGQSWTILTEENSELPGNLIEDIAEDKWGNIWVAVATVFSQPLFLMRYRDDSWTRFDIPFTANGALIINGIIPDEDGTLWVAISGSGGALAHFDGVDWEFYTSQNSGLRNSKYLSNVMLDKQGHVWVGNQHGIAEFDGNTWANYDDANSELSGFSVTSIFVDKEGVKWIGDTRLGVVRFDGQSWAVYPLATAPKAVRHLSTIAIDGNNNAWIDAPGLGLRRFNGRDWTIFDSSNSPLSHHGVIDIKIDENNQIWIADSTRLLQFDGLNWTIYPDSFGEISSLAIGADNTVWIWAGLSLIEYNTAERTLVQHFLREETGLDARQVTPLLRDNDFLWIGTDKGLVNYDGVSWTVYDTTDFDLGNNHVRALALDNDGNLLVGGYGLVSFDGQNWQSYDELNELLARSTPINSILTDSDDNIWLAAKGLFQFDGEEWQLFNTINSGLSEKDITTLAMDGSGNLWIGTLNLGVDIYREGGISGNFQAYRQESYTRPQSHVPDQQVFYHVYPNPFNQYTTIRIDLAQPGFVKARVFDILGREVDVLINSPKPAGSHYTVFGGPGLSSGVYFLQVQAGRESSVRKIVLVK